MFQFEAGAAAGQPARMRVLVTGAFGRLGLEGIERLLNEGHSVIAFDVSDRRNRKAARRFEDRVRIVWGDIRSRADVLAAVVDCDAIIHNAGVLAPASELHRELAYAVNVGGTKNMIDAMRRMNAPPVIVFASSLAVCGPRVPGGSPLTGDLQAVGTDNYSANKAMCEKLLRESGLPYVIFRIGVSVGVRAAAGDLSPDVFRLLFSINPDTRLEWVHPEDVALAQVRAIECRGALGKTLMIGGGESCRLTFGEFYGAVFEATGVGRFPLEAYGSGAYYCDWMDTDESQSLLAYQRISFDEFIARLRKASRFTRPLAHMFAPLIRGYMLRYSDAWQSRKGRA
ncbi:MAG: NAD(P)-dependent oxidoreductase [Deltaproteobacteria bacterium]|nr:NAD(P)-dependent oxidoreductase [Deltaproteobacteria bacterium]